MELGKLQKAWVESLRKHPERQLKGKLGHRYNKSYQACCLGELLCTDYRLRKKKMPFVDCILGDGNFKHTLHTSYLKYGLYDHVGGFKQCVFYQNGVIYLNSSELDPSQHYTMFGSLADMNDKELPWPQIADFIEQHPAICIKIKK